MLKVLESTKSIIWPGKSKVELGSDSKAVCDGGCKLNESEISNNEFDSGEVKDDKFKKKSQKKSKSKICLNPKNYLSLKKP